MRYRLFGPTGLRVSELCLGTMTFGEDWDFGASREESWAMFEAFAEAGGNFVDTANSYTFGTSEKLVGEFIAAERDYFVLSTKYSMNTRGEDINTGGNHRKNMMRSLDQSLRRLNTEFIDIYWLHVWDFITPVEEVMRGLEDIVRGGKALYIGISDTPAWVVSRANMLAELRGWAQFIGLQAEYNLIERGAERDLLPMAHALGLGVVAWAPLAGGVLTGKYARVNGNVEVADSRRGEWLNAARLNDKALRIAQVVTEVASELGWPPAQVALAWIRQRPSGIIPIVGNRTLSQLKENLGCLELRLGDAHRDRLDAESQIELGFPHSFIRSEPVLSALFGSQRSRLDAPRS
jgi:aryl-alcohol dehydrogenase-like predicted oxidoreductase